MLVIPKQINPREYVLVIVLGQDNIERMMANDPAQLGLYQLPPPWPDLRCRDLFIAYETDENMARIETLCRQQNEREAWEYLMRGWQNRPDKGDGGGHLWLAGIGRTVEG